MNHRADASPADALILAITRLEATEAALRSRLRGRFSVSNTDVTALQLLDRAERQGRELTVTELSPLLGISNPACTALVNRLEAGGHVARRIVPGNRRARRVVLTDRARGELLAAMTITRERLDELVVDLSDLELHRAVELIDRVTDALEDGAPFLAPSRFDTSMPARRKSSILEAKPSLYFAD
ncbi:MAG: MarR family transcriptional regulator [Microbacteriaceae bacterium]